MHSLSVGCNIVYARRIVLVIDLLRHPLVSFKQTHYQCTRCQLLVRYLFAKFVNTKVIPGQTSYSFIVTNHSRTPSILVAYFQPRTTLYLRAICFDEARVSAETSKLSRGHVSSAMHFGTFSVFSTSHVTSTVMTLFISASYVRQRQVTSIGTP